MIRFDDETLLEFLLEHTDPPTTVFDWVGLVEYRSPVNHNAYFFRGKTYFVFVLLPSRQTWTILGTDGFLKSFIVSEYDLEQDGYLTYDNDYNMIFVKEEKVNG